MSQITKRYSLLFADTFTSTHKLSKCVPALVLLEDGLGLFFVTTTQLCELLQAEQHALSMRAIRERRLQGHQL
ncbi:hypothetical protein EON65_49590 [archaeon]|nr:MAG: hypothetical protein EON65_49590 [archaeon]